MLPENRGSSQTKDFSQCFTSGSPGHLCKRVYRLYVTYLLLQTFAHLCGAQHLPVGERPFRRRSKADTPGSPPPQGRPPPGAERPAPLPSERPPAPHLPSGSAANGRVGLTRCAAASSGGGRALREPRRVGGFRRGERRWGSPAPRNRFPQRQARAWCAAARRLVRGAQRATRAMHEAEPERFAAAAVGEQPCSEHALLPRGRVPSSFPRFLLFEV